MVWPVTASLAVAGQRTSSRLITGPVFTFRGTGVPKNFIFLEAVDDARLVNVVRRHLEFDAIANGKSNKSFAHFSGNVRQDKMLVGQSDPEHGAGKDRHDRSFQLKSFFGVHDREQAGSEILEAGCNNRFRIYRRLPAKERLPPPPYGRGRSSRGRASLTLRGRPFSSLPLSALIAASASAFSFMVMNAKPRDLPVMRSIISATSPTWPCCSKRS